PSPEINGHTVRPCCIVIGLAFHPIVPAHLAVASLPVCGDYCHGSAFSISASLLRRARAPPPSSWAHRSFSRPAARHFGPCFQACRRAVLRRASAYLCHCDAFSCYGHPVGLSYPVPPHSRSH